jgi:hypothetical protein
VTNPGLYRSDIQGHLLLFEKNPTRVTCLICKESAEAKKAQAAAFTAKHGCLDEYLAPDAQEYLYQRLGLTEAKIQEILLSDSRIHWNILLSTGR